MKNVKNAVGRAVIQKLIVVHINMTEPFVVSLFRVFLREEKFMLYSLLILCYSLCILFHMHYICSALNTSLRMVHFGWIWPFL